MPRIVRFDLANVATYEVQAALLAFIAWPADKPGSPSQSQAQVALVGHMFRSAAKAAPAFAHKPITLRPIYLLVGEQETATMARRTYERLRRNMIAMRALRPFVQEGLFGTDAPPLPADLPRLSLNAVTEWVTIREPGDRDAHNFEHKVVRPLFPVLHLGIALEMVLQKAERLTGQTPKAEILMTTPELTRDMVALAQQLEPVVLGIKQFTVSEESQVRVRLSG